MSKNDRQNCLVFAATFALTGALAGTTNSPAVTRTSPDQRQSGLVAVWDPRDPEGRRGQASLTMKAVTMPNMPSSRSAWVRMWQCQAHTPGSTSL